MQVHETDSSVLLQLATLRRLKPSFYQIFCEPVTGSNLNHMNRN